MLESCFDLFCKKNYGEICGFSTNYKVLKIWHIHARTYNFGDHALGIAVRKLIRGALRKHHIEAIFEIVDTHRFYISKKDVDMFNYEGGLILIGGGGLLHCWDRIHWMFHCPTRLLKLLRLPICVFGVGYNQLKRQGSLPASVKRNIRALQKKALAFSVRNDGTYEKMLNETFSFDTIPDPGFFLDGKYSHPDINGPYVIIQLAGDGIADRMPNFKQWQENIIACAKWLVNKKLFIVFIPHCELDCLIINEITSALDCNSYLVTNFWDGILDEECLKILSYYKFAEFVLASRGHSQIISFGMKVPFATFSTHYKQKSLSKQLGLSEYVTDNPEQFLQCMTHAWNDREKIIELETSGMLRLREQMDFYLDQLAEKIAKSMLKPSQNWIDFKKVQIIDYLRYLF
jgi:polysaccharide pyruvyl transferase WcaK-like protein